MQQAGGLLAGNFVVHPSDGRPSPVSCSQERTGYRPLVCWLEEKGGHMADEIRLEWIPGRGRGIITSKAIPKGRVLAEIPWTIILSSKLASEDPDVQALLHDLPCSGDKSDGYVVRLWLLRHGSDAQSPWWPWLSQLPQDAGAGSGCLPLALAEQARNAFRGTPIARRAEVLLESLREEWQALDAQRGQHPWVACCQRWLWSQAIVSTRSGTLPLDGGQENVHCVIPLLDFLNHSAQPNACIMANMECAKLVSTESIEAGQEVLICYGKHSAEQFLFAFGFVPEGSAPDIPVPLALTEAPEVLGPGRHLSLRKILEENALDSVLQVLAAEPAFVGWSRQRLLEHLQTVLESWHRELMRTSFWPWERYPEAEFLCRCYAVSVEKTQEAVRAELIKRP